MNLPNELLKKLKEKGFNKKCVCCAVDWFKEKHNIFINYSWLIDQEAGNKIVWTFKIEYIWGYKEPYKNIKIEKVQDEETECKIKSIEEALNLI